MTPDTTYNGWTNYATWRVNLEFFDGMELIDIHEPQPDVNDLADQLEEMLNQHLEETASGLGLDYARAFVSDVDFHDIAKSMIRDAGFILEDA